MTEPADQLFRVTLLGTGAPPPRWDRCGPSTLVEVGAEKFIFDAGRGAMQRLHQLGIPFSAITGMFLTHHHSDHVVGFPDLWLTGWIGRPWGQRKIPLRVWGPQGTTADDGASAPGVCGRYSGAQQKLSARRREVAGGRNQRRNCLQRITGLPSARSRSTTAARNLPAFGYRIDFDGHSAVLSGDTTFNRNLIEHSRGADLLVHEVTAAAGSAAESLQQLKRIGANHTTPDQAGQIFAEVKPKLAVYNHLLLFGGAKAEDLIPMTRGNYSGPLIVGEDLLQLDLRRDCRSPTLPR